MGPEKFMFGGWWIIPIVMCIIMMVFFFIMSGRSGFRPPWMQKEERGIRKRANEIIAMLSLDDVADEEAASLPFGRQRAVELARALAADPKLLLLDEPASGLNIHETDDLADLIRNIREMGITVLLVEHDMSLVMNICDEVAVLNFGRKIAEGTPQEISTSKTVVEVYLGV